MPQTTKLMIQLASAMRSGESPLTSAPTSVSADARVARPKRVKRNRTVSTIPRAMIVPASHRRSVEMPTPRTLMWFWGKIGLTLMTCVPTWYCTTAVSSAHEPDGRHRLGHRPVVAQRPEDEQVTERAEDGLDGQRHQEGRPEPPGRAHADRRREARDRVEQLAVAQERVGVGRVESLGAGGEVEDARRAVGDHHGHGQGGEDAAVPQPQQQELDVGAHALPGRLSDGLSTY